MVLLHVMQHAPCAHADVSRFDGQRFKVVDPPPQCVQLLPGEYHAVFFQSFLSVLTVVSLVVKSNGLIESIVRRGVATTLTGFVLAIPVTTWESLVGDTGSQVLAKAMLA
eukprot:SAG31_NODE_11889_length_988_cov_1.250844_2_plen_109_part_01